MENSKTIGDIIRKSTEIGDSFQEKAIAEMDIEMARVANSAYNNAVRGLTAQLVYHKLKRGQAGFEIDFLETKK